MAADVLVVDDEADIRDLVSGLLEDEGYAVRTASNADRRWLAIRARKPTLLVLDIWMQGGGMDGLELLDLVKALDADLPVIMISGHGNIETAVSALKRGAYEFHREAVQVGSAAGGGRTGPGAGHAEAREPDAARAGLDARRADRHLAGRPAAAQP
jgi:DNA-binding NtrC family response regulator